MRTYSNIFIHIPGFTKSDLEFISNSTETVYIGSRRIAKNNSHLIHVGIRYNDKEYNKEEFEVDSIERDIILGVIQEVFLTILGKVIDDKNNKKDFRDNK